MNNQKLTQLFLTIRDCYDKGQYKVLRQSSPVMDIDELALNHILYRWLSERGDSRADDISNIWMPLCIVDLSDVSFSELLDFCSPQTERTKKRTPTTF